MYQAVIVDDEPYIVEHLAKAIDWNGFQLEIGYAATSSVKALEYILANPVSIVITDIAMPDMDGLKLIQRIKEAKPYIYVIVLSAYNNFEYARTALKYGAENYLLKPIDSDELSDTISQIAGHIMEREQLNSTYGQAMLTFRNAFTEQWAKNLLSGNELATKAKLLGIDLQASEFTAVVFSCAHGSPDIMSKFFDLFLHYLPGKYTGNFYFEAPTCLVGILSPVPSCSEEIKDFIRRIIHDASSAGLHVFASAGPHVSHFSEVHMSCRQACSYVWLEHTRLLSYFQKGNQSLADDACQALEEYEKGPEENISPIKKLYEKYPAFSCTAALLTQRIQLICKDVYKLAGEFPELTERLAGLPVKSSDASDYARYTLQFLRYSSHLLSKIQQSMYPCVDAVIKIVGESDDKDISLKTLAIKLNVSPSYLGTIFRRQTGYYFNDYLAEIRLKKAAELLESTDLKIKDIVDRTGFSSQAYFTRTFKRFYNVSPASYRRERSVKGAAACAMNSHSPSTQYADK